MLRRIWEKDKRWEENSVVLPRGLTSGASRMAAQSCKETTDVWELQQSPGEKRGQSLGTKRGHVLLLLTSALSTRITAVD